MNLVLKNLLLLLAENLTDFRTVQAALIVLEPELNSWEQTLAQRIIEAKGLTEVFAALFEITPPEHLTAEVFETVIEPIFIAYTRLARTQPSEYRQSQVRQLFGYLQDYFKNNPQARKNFFAQLPNDVEWFLYSLDCFTVEDWIVHYGEGATITAGGELIISREERTGQDLMNRRVTMGPNRIDSLAQVLKTDTSLKRIRLHRCAISTREYATLTNALANNSTLETLILDWNDIGDAEAIALANALATNSTLKTLDLTGNEIGDAGAIALANALATNSTLKTLDLTGNEIGNAGAIALANALAANSTLKTLILDWNDIGDAGLSALADALKPDMNLELRVNSKHKTGALAWIKALETNHNHLVTKFSLSFHYTSLNDDEVLQAFLSLLNKNTNINDVNISALSFIGHPHLDLIVQALADRLSTGSLKSIEICAFVGDTGTKALANQLATNTSLLKLGFGNCTTITNEGAEALAKALETNSTLAILSEFENLDRIDQKILDKIDAAIARNQHYATLHKEIDACIESLAGLLKEEEQNVSEEKAAIIGKKIEALINQALQGVQELYHAKPPYAHAKALLDQVQHQSAFIYAQYGDYQAFIDLYLDYFAEHADDVINLELASLLITLEDDQYTTAGLTIETDKQQLILVLLAGNKEPQSDAFRSHALQVLKGQGMGAATFAEVAGVPNDGIIITFAELALLAEQLNQLEEENLEAEQKTLLQRIKMGKVYVYEQIIMEPQAELKPVEFNQEMGTLNQDTFRPYSERVAEKKNISLVSLNIANTLSALSVAIQKNYGKTFDQFSVWHSRTLTARRLAELSPNLTLAQLRIILEVELNAKQREHGLSSKPKSHSLFPLIQQGNLVDILKKELLALPQPDAVEGDQFLNLKKELAELLLSWVDTEERSLMYKLFHKPDQNDALSQRIKMGGRISAQNIIL